jgi:hypothetical protein
MMPIVPRRLPAMAHYLRAIDYFNARRMRLARIPLEPLQGRTDAGETGGPFYGGGALPYLPIGTSPVCSSLTLHKSEPANQLPGTQPHA